MPEVSPAATLLFLRDEELRHGLRLLLSAERQITVEAEAILAERGLAANHGQIVMIAARQTQISTQAALAPLRMSKQSGSRLVRDLVERGYLTQRTSPNDRRQRQLSLTDEGRRLDRLLWDRQRPRIVRAFRACGPDAVEGFRKVLLALAEGVPARPVPQRIAP